MKHLSTKSAKNFIKIALLALLILLLHNNVINAQCGETLLNCGDNFTTDTRFGSNNYDRNDYGSCYSGPNQFNAKDLLFKIEKTDYEVWHISIHNGGNIDLDMFLLDACDNGWEGRSPQSLACLDKSINGYGVVFQNINYDVITLINPGVYYIVVDGYNQNQEGAFTINVGCDDFVWDDFRPCNEVAQPLKCGETKEGYVGCNCPPNVFCLCDSPKMNHYSCLPDNKRGSMTGYESIFSFTADEPGEYTINCTNLDDDLDLFILSDFCFPIPNGLSKYNCLAYSNNSGNQNEIISIDLVAGQTITIVLDGFLGASGGFNISVSCPIIKECNAECCSFPSKYSDCYSFEEYILGNLLPQASPRFSTQNTTSQNALVTNEKVKNGVRAIKCNASSSIDLNINRNIGEIAARLEWWMYIPSQKSSQWAIKTNSTTIGAIIMETKNGLCKVGTGTMTNPTFSTSFNINTDSWVKHALIFQPHENEIELWIDGKFVYKETNYQSNAIGQLRFYGRSNDQTNLYYIDDICYQELYSLILCSPDFTPICYNDKQYQNSCYAFHDGYTSCERSCNDLDCSNASNVFTEDFDKESLNSFGYKEGEKISKNSTWWEGDYAILRSESAYVPAEKTLKLKLNNSILSLYESYKVTFNYEFDWSRWGIPIQTIVNDEFCLMDQNTCVQKILLSDLVSKLNKIPDCFSGGDLGTCTAYFELVIDRKGGVELYVSGEKISNLPPISGANITAIEFKGETSIDNLIINGCKGSSNPNQPTVNFDIDDNVCASVGSIVKIPIRVKNFTDITSFQYSIKLNEPTKGEIVSIEKGNLAGDLNYGLISTSLATVVWDNLTPISLTDNSIVLYVNIKIKTIFTGTSTIEITGSPAELSAEQNDKTVIPIVAQGSFCAQNNTYSICGKVLREDNVPVPNVEVKLSGYKTATTTTNDNGLYCFEQLEGNQNYTITPYKNTNHVNGVNTGDVTAIRRHILALEKLNTPYKIIAADANRSGSVNTGDVTEIRKLILAIISQYSSNTSWLFVPNSYSFPNAQNPFSTAFPTTVTFNNLSTDQYNTDFVGIKIGDVNLSNTPSKINGNTDTRQLNDITLAVGSATIMGNQQFDIPISVGQFQNIVSGQFSVNWNPNYAHYLSVQNFNSSLGISNDNFNQAFTSQGKLGFLWESSSTNAYNLPEDAILFTLRFNASGNGLSEITISDDPVEKYFEDGNKASINIKVVNGSITVPSEDLLVSGISVFPNPTTGIINISSGDAQIQSIKILDNTGKIIKTSDITDIKTINISEFSAGVYHIKVQCDLGTVVKKIVLMPQ